MPQAGRDDLRALYEELCDSVSENTRDLARIAKHLDDRSDDIEAVQTLTTEIRLLEQRIEHIDRQADKLAKILVVGNGQKALTIQVHELSVRMAAIQQALETRAPHRQKHDTEQSKVAIEDVRGKWKFRALIAAPLITGALELLHWWASSTGH